MLDPIEIHTRLRVFREPNRQAGCQRHISERIFGVMRQLLPTMAEPPVSETKIDVPKVPEEIFRVVINAERQYSIWPDWKKNAPGWEDEGTKGPKQECLDHIEKVWTDMRPLSLQKFMAPFEKEPRKPIVLPPMPTDGVDHFHSTHIGTF